ncbi:MAG: HEAT repeat domain-containing protein [Candidatus Helarchaeota archaeon]
MVPDTVESEFRELQDGIVDEDPIVRGMAAIDFSTFALEHPDYKDRTISLLQRALNDPDEDVRINAQQSLNQIEGKKTLLEPGKQIIGFGYVPEQYRQTEVDTKQMVLSCVCCIILIVVMILMFIYIF